MTHNLSISRWLVMAAVSFFANASAFADSTTLHSGKYEQLMLAVTPEHQVEGYYEEERGEDPPFRCAFYLKGNIEAGKDVAVSSWSDGAYPGTLKPSTDGVTLTIEEGQQNSGCLNVLMPEIATGLDLTRTASTQWISLVKVKADKAWLQKTANAKAKATRGAYIVKGDVVGVLAFKDGAAQVEFINADNRSFTGWISQDQYARLTVPEH